MPLIDGIGDEVVQFAAVVIVVTVAALAWWSTSARPDRYRTVLLMRSHTHHPVTLSIHTGVSPPTMLYTNRQTNPLSQSSGTGTVTVTSISSGVENSSSANDEDVVPLQEMDSIVDADMALLDNNRLHFYRRLNSPRITHTANESTSEESEPIDDTEPASNAQIREMDSIVSAMEADVSNNCDVFSRPNAENSNSTLKSRVKKDANDKADSKVTPSTTTEETGTNQNGEGEQAIDNATSTEVSNDRKILIRLKYLNDTLKEVEGSLDELLKDFKWRHFSSELSSEYRVRLIFNGHVLCDESATLRALGLHHRAVVHCLVHPKRTPTQRGGGPEEATAAPELGAPRAQPDRAWDLENILMTLVSVALTVVWFFRCEYSNMFTASASVALFGLTVFYSVAIFGLYLSDTFHFDRRQPQPVPNN